MTEWIYLVDVNCPCLVVVRVCNFVQMILLVTSGKEQLVFVILGSLFFVPEKSNGIRLFALAVWTLKLAMALLLTPWLVST